MVTRDRRLDRLAVHQNRLVVVVGQRPAGTGGNQPEVTGHHHPNTPFRIGAKGNFCPLGRPGHGQGRGLLCQQRLDKSKDQGRQDVN